MASIEDAAECGERADALVSGLLIRVMRQRRSVAAAVDYIRALSRETRARTWDAINRHTALTALAQLRTTAIRAALNRAAVLPAAPASRDPASETTVNPADLQIYTGDAPLPARGGQPCPPGIPPIGLSDAETARIERLARDRKAGLISTARLAFHLRWSAWRRRHQARARWHHYSTRLAALAT